ncbi:MAG: CoA transferase, partial [Thermoplasmata archaeon]
GRGVHIDLSQFENALQFIGPVLMSYILNGEIYERVGNRDPQACPHGAFRCRGDDRWIFIEVWNDDEWKALVRVMGEPEWASDERFKTFRGRKENEDELERLIEAWTITKDAYELMDMLQKEGVPAGVVQKGEDLYRDPYLKSLPYYWELEHPEIGKHHYEGPPFKLSKTPAKLEMPAPTLGQHTEFVVTRFLGYSDEEFVEMLQEGVFE